MPTPLEKTQSDTTRAVKSGNAYMARIPRQIWDELLWRAGDPLIVRKVGQKLVFERVPVETLAIFGSSALEGSR